MCRVFELQSDGLQTLQCSSSSKYLNQLTKQERSEKTTDLLTSVLTKDSRL